MKLQFDVAGAVERGATKGCGFQCTAIECVCPEMIDDRDAYSYFGVV